MRQQAVQPSQFVLELWTRRRMSVGKIKATVPDAVDRGLDVAAVAVIRVSGQCPANFFGLRVPCENGDAIPAFLSVPDDTISGVADCSLRKLLLRRLQFLQADHIRRRLGQPAHQTGYACIDAIDVVSDDTHHPLSS